MLEREITIRATDLAAVRRWPADADGRRLAAPEAELWQAHRRERPELRPDMVDG